MGGVGTKVEALLPLTHTLFRRTLATTTTSTTSTTIHVQASPATSTTATAAAVVVPASSGSEQGTLAFQGVQLLLWRCVCVCVSGPNQKTGEGMDNSECELSKRWRTGSH